MLVLGLREVGHAFGDQRHVQDMPGRLAAGTPKVAGPMTGVLYDSIDVTQIPLGAPAVAGYVNGSWATWASLAIKFPNARRLSIAVTSSADADCLDVEQGDAAVADAPGWVTRRRARGITRPCLYASVSVMNSLVWTIEAAGIPRSSVRLWSAHYAGQHICGPTTCALTASTMDGTQWTSSALGRNLDQSLIADDFFTSGWQEAMMNALPTLQQGNKDTAGQPLDVHRVQVLVAGIGRWNNLGTITAVADTGVFDAATSAAVKRVQQFFGLTQDGIVGPATWGALATGSA